MEMVIADKKKKRTKNASYCCDSLYHIIFNSRTWELFYRGPHSGTHKKVFLPPQYYYDNMMNFGIAILSIKTRDLKQWIIYKMADSAWPSNRNKTKLPNQPAGLPRFGTMIKRVRLSESTHQRIIRWIGWARVQGLGVFNGYNNEVTGETGNKNNLKNRRKNWRGLS